MTNYGTVTINGTTYTVATQPETSNYGTNPTRIVYVATGIAPNGEKVTLRWHLTPEYHAAMVAWVDGDGAEPDESDACDWDVAELA